MSDLIGGGSSSAGNGRGGNGRAPPGNTGSPSIKGPRDIMRERAAREARRKQEQEDRDALERRRAEEEARLLEEEKRRSAERRAAAAGVAAEQRERERTRTSGGTTGQRISDNSQRSERRSGGTGQPELQGVGRGGQAVGGGDAATSRPRPSQSQGRLPAQEPARHRAEQTATATPGPSNAPQQPTTSQQRSSFPHAFERWETLSAHWEGLTSFWIRRLEENSNEINRDPLSQQLARQVTDLSAAGANLFHAVVELQRLRASSERKFQRWFFETRAEQERAQEIQAQLQTAFNQERKLREDAVAELATLQTQRAETVNKAAFEKQLSEMKRELQISKEEARRAWEELGRREQEERERTSSLRDGHPTLVGGVQVVPMMQGVPSRHGSAREQPSARDGYATSAPEGPVDGDLAYDAYSRSQRAEPSDPFVDSTSRAQSRPTPPTFPPTALAQHPAFTKSHESSQAPAVQPATSPAFYAQQQGTSLHPVDRSQAQSRQSAPSEGAFSEEEYEIDSQGHFILDARGQKVPYQAPVSDDDTDEYDVAEQRERELANLELYGTSGPARTGISAPSSNPTIGEPVDYSGQGYGAAAPEWAAVPRHHHPTRLSDVLEEDERSRTSASQVSRNN